MSIDQEKAYRFSELKWDTDFFGISCARAVLEGELSREEWDELKRLMEGYRFVSIVNRHSLPGNSLLIGMETRAFLADVNIQLEKEADPARAMPAGVEVASGLARDENILAMANYPASKFIADQEFNRRNGSEVYREWLKNSFGRKDKYFALSRDSGGGRNGFLLFSYRGDTCTIELVAVSAYVEKRGIGTDLLKACEISAQAAGCRIIRVGTQIRNTTAINFYHKYGFRMVGCHQVFHLWNPEADNDGRGSMGS